MLTADPQHLRLRLPRPRKRLREVTTQTTTGTGGERCCELHTWWATQGVRARSRQKGASPTPKPYTPTRPWPSLRTQMHNTVAACDAAAACCTQRCHPLSRGPSAAAAPPRPHVAKSLNTHTPDHARGPNPGAWAAAKPLACDASGLWVAAGGPSSHTTGVSLGLLGAHPPAKPCMHTKPTAVSAGAAAATKHCSAANRAQLHTNTLTHKPHTCKYTPQNSPTNPRHPPTQTPK